MDQVIKVNKKTFPNRDQVNAQKKKSSKPLMEKKRRERINYSLAALKTILHDTITNHGKCKSKKSKIEKADILEMVVRQFRVIRAFEQSDLNKYAAGYIDCAAEIVRYLECPEIISLCASDLLGSNIKSLIIQHLELCTHEMTEGLSEQAASVIEREPNKNLSPTYASSSGVHTDKVTTPPNPQEEIVSTPVAEDKNAYLHFGDKSAHYSEHIAPSGSGDELMHVARAHQSISEKIQSMESEFPNFVQSDDIATTSNYMNYRTSFPARYLVTNQHGLTMTSEDHGSVTYDDKDNKMFTLEEYIGAAVEGAVNERPVLQSNMNKISHIPKKQHSERTEKKPATNETQKNHVEHEMPIDYSLKSDLFPKNEP